MEQTPACEDWDQMEGVIIFFIAQVNWEGVQRKAPSDFWSSANSPHNSQADTGLIEKGI